MSNVVIVAIILFLYFVGNLAISLRSNKEIEQTPDDYFLAGRKTGAFVLFLQ